MGLNIHALRLMLHAKEQGADLERVVTIGRLDVLVTPGQLEEEFAAFRDPLKPGEAMQLIQAEDRFCEPIIKRIGARTVDALDASDYEGANILHDLNRPLPDEHKKKYSLLLDGGTLEHVFHFPEALKSCMSMVEVGGHVLFALPANNEMGHGFYQFSPELFFRALSDANGFQMRGLYLAPIYRDGEWLQVTDPAVLRQRVGHNRSIDEMGLLVFAQRVRDVPLLEQPPQQSDYAVAWEEIDQAHRLEFFDQASAPADDGWKRKAKRLIPEPMLRIRRLILAGKHVTTPPDPSQFTPYDPRLPHNRSAATQVDERHIEAPKLGLRGSGGNSE